MIPYCSMSEISFDRCHQCDDSYTLTTDGMKCIDKIPNCKVYN